MKHPKTVLLTAAAFGLAAIPLTATYYSVPGSGVISGVSVFLFLLSIRMLDRTYLQESAVKKLRVTGTLVERTGVLMLVSAGFFTDVLPLRAGLLALVLVASTMLFRENLVRKFSRSFEPELGLNIWMAVLGLIFFASQFNDYFLFYGYLLFSAVTGYDLIQLYRKLWSQNLV